MRGLGITSCIIVLFLGSCCDRKTRRIQPHWLRAMENYELIVIQLNRQAATEADAIEVMPVSQSHERCFHRDAIRGCIADVRYGFWLDLTNDSGTPLRLLWPEARYLDEKASSHEVFAQERGALPDDRGNLRSPPAQVVASGGRTRPTIVPIYKQYLVASGCRDLYPYSEPLIPTKLDDKDEQQMKAYVDDLARRQVPVKLLLPIEIDGKRIDYTFTFVLKDRWSDLPKD